MSDDNVSERDPAPRAGSSTARDGRVWRRWVLLGVIVLIGGIGLLAYLIEREPRLATVIEVDANRVDPANDGKLVYLVGVPDPAYGIAPALRRCGVAPGETVTIIAVQREGALSYFGYAEACALRPQHSVCLPCCSNCFCNRAAPLSFFNIVIRRGAVSLDKLLHQLAVDKGDKGAPPACG
jgi:hypothetical protein